jgi:hypothetical protein
MLDEEDDDGNNIGEDSVRRMIKTLRWCARTFGIVATDAGRGAGVTADGQPVAAKPADTLQSIAESSGDLSKINSAALDHWVYAIQRPRTIALGEGTNGLRGGDNDGDQQKWGGDVQLRRMVVGTPTINWMLMHEFAAKRGPTKGIIPQKWTLNWRPLRMQTPAEIAAERKAINEGDLMLKSAGIVTGDEIRQQRLVNGDYAGALKVTGKLAEEVSREPLTVGLIDSLVALLTSIAKRELPVEVFASAADMLSEGRIDRVRAGELADELRNGLGNMGGPAAPPAGAGPVSIQTPPPAADGAPEDAEPEEPEPAPFSTDPRPNDLMEPREIAKLIQERFGLPYGSASVTALAKRHGLRRWPVGTKSGFSKAEIFKAFDDDLLEPEPAAVSAEPPGTPA